MKPDKRQRHELYLQVLNNLNKKGSITGICLQLYYLSPFNMNIPNWHSFVDEFFPEFSLFNPLKEDHLLPYELRKTALLFCIEMTKDITKPKN